MVTVNEVFRDFVIGNIPSSGANEPPKSDIRELLSAISTGSASGIYDFIPASNVGAGTANAIVATTDVPLPATPNGALIALPIIVANTAPLVTVAFNGGASLTIKTTSGSNVAVGGLTAPTVVAGYVSGDTFRLLSDQASAAIQAAAEAARNLAAGYAGDAEAARDIAAGYASDAVSQGNVPIYATIAGMPALSVPVGINLIRVNGEATADDGKGGTFSRETSGGEFITADGSHWMRVLGFTANTPFGKSGVRVLMGDKDDAHYGLGSGWDHFVDTGKTVFAYRKAAKHGITNGSEVWLADSYDKGMTLVNHRMIYTNTTYDTRVQGMRRLGNGRSGFLCNLMAENGDDFNPILIYSDDQWVTKSVKTFVRPTGSTAYSFSSHGGIMDFPASQGGHNTLGFIAFGYMSATQGLDALYTSDNFATYTWSASKVCVPSTPFTTVSEWSGSAIGSDRWIFYVRNSLSEAMCFTTTNLLNWGPSSESNINIGGNPPATFYDPVTNKFHLVITSRNSRVVYGYTNWMLMASADADALWTANGDWTALPVPVLEPEPIMPMPDWFTGYWEIRKMGGAWWGTVVCGENGVDDGLSSLLAWMGDFTPSGSDAEKWGDFLRNRQVAQSQIDLYAKDNSPTTYTYTAENLAASLKSGFGAYGFSNKLGSSQTSDFEFDVGGYAEFDKIRALGTVLKLHPTNLLIGIGLEAAYATDAQVHIPVASATKGAITSEAGSGSARTHYAFRNINGLVGSISTSASATTFATTSDEMFKEFIGKYDPTVALEIIRADPVRAFMWDKARGGGHAIGWGAQTSYKVSADLASPGGWFGLDGEPCELETEGAVYIPWGVDPAKRTPYLWTVVPWMVDRIEALETERDALKLEISAIDNRLTTMEKR